MNSNKEQARQKRINAEVEAEERDIDSLADNPRLCNTIEHNIRNLAKLKYREAGQRHRQERVADAITDFSGSMAFVYLHVVFFAGWILINTLPHIKHIDPFPFNFLTMVVSLEAIFLSTFVLISQNRQGDQVNKRAELDLHIGLLTEHEATRILRMLHNIQDRLGIEDADEELSDLEAIVKPQDVLAEIDRVELRTRDAARRLAHHQAMHHPQKPTAK